jgi:hypothetical protein
MAADSLYPYARKVQVVCWDFSVARFFEILKLFEIFRFFLY